MSDNIIDFNEHKKEKEEANQTIDFSPEAMMERLASLPENGLMTSINEAVSLRMMKLLLLADIGAQATEGLKAAGFDPDDFNLDEESLDRFLSEDLAPDEVSPWNGPWFDWYTDDATVRLATTISFSGESGEGTPVDVTMNLLKLDDDGDCWEIFTGDGWDKDGPPADYFDDEDGFGPDDWDDDEDDEDDWDEDDEDWDEDEDDDEGEDVNLFDLDLPQATFIALVKGGVENIDQLTEMSDAQLLAIDGIDARAVKRIRRELADWDLSAGE